MQRKLLILSCLCCILFIFVHNNRHAQAQTGGGETVDYKKPGAPMPALRLVTPDLTAAAKMEGKQESTATDRVITEKELDNGANLLVMMFNPTCGHCEDQTTLLAKHIHLFKNTKLVLMAGPMMLPYLEHFNRDVHVSGYPETMLMGVDSSGFIEKTFLYETLPQINIYDHQRRLLRTFTGLTPVDTLKAYIE